MRKFLAIAMVACLGVAAARAEEPAALATELLSLMKIDENMKQAFDMTKQMMVQQVSQMEKLTGQSSGGKAADYQSRVLDLVADEMSWEKLKGPYIDLYASTFTAEELKGLVDFYKSPIGQTFIRKQPDLMKKTMQLNQKMQMELMPKLQQLVQEMKAAMPAAPKPAPAAPAAP